MWIIARLAIAFVGFCVRHLRFHTHFDLETIEGISYAQTFKGGWLLNFLSRNKTHLLAIPTNKNIFFEIIRETKIDHFCKSIGLNGEFQTGDTNFDQKLYIKCDHVIFGKFLKESSKTRAILLELFEKDFQIKKIWCNGHYIFLESSARLDPPLLWVLKLNEIRKELDAFYQMPREKFSDPYFARAIFIEAILWGITGYSLVSMIENSAHPESYYPDSMQLILWGLGFSAVIFVLLCLLIFKLLKGSSRCHRIMVDSYLLLLLSLPLFGIQTLSDFNRGADMEPGFSMEAKVEKKWTETHRSRRGKRTTHHVRIHPESDNFKLPRKIQISSSLYYSLREGEFINIELGPGRLGFPWYRSIGGARYDVWE